MQQIKFKDKIAPHLVILGAGASRACVPNGDINQKQLPLMQDLVTITGLESILINSKYRDRLTENFEDLFSDIYEEGNDELISRLQNHLYNYFQDLKIPKHPTIYDYLVCSLREKDYIASFNWDSLLLQAYCRCPFKSKPRLIFLHGNVAVGYSELGQIVGLNQNEFSSKGDQLTRSSLLYPIKNKNYNSDPFILKQWEDFRSVLEKAYYVTVFGYSVPKTDIEAKTRMLEAWGQNKLQELLQFACIDIDRTALSKWTEFICEHHHDEHHESFFESKLAQFPRRTCEYLWEEKMECKFLKYEIMPDDFSSLDDLYNWFTPCLNQEM